MVPSPSPTIKKGDWVRLLERSGGDAEVGDVGLVTSGGVSLRVDFQTQRDYATQPARVEKIEIAKVGDKVMCVRSRIFNVGGNGGAGWEEGKEFTVNRVTGSLNAGTLIYWNDEELNGGVYALHTRPAKKKLEAIKMPVKIEPFNGEGLGKHDILGQDKIHKQLELAAEKDIPALIVGDTGSGKTTIVKSIADKKNRKYTRFNLTGETTVDEFVGKYVLRDKQTIWEDGVLLAAMKAGHWLIVDEINVALPEILFVLHSLLDDDRSVLVANHNGEIVKPHPKFRFFGTMNPVDEYAGTKDLNKAFKSRFGMILNMDYPAPEIEAQVVAAKGGVPQETAMKITDVGQAIRKAKASGDAFYTCSTRDLIQWAILVEDLGLQEAFEVSVLNKANGDGEVVKKAFTTICGAYEDAKKSGNDLNLDNLVAINSKLEADKALISKKASDVRRQVKGELLKQLINKTEDSDLKQLVKELT